MALGNRLLHRPCLARLLLCGAGGGRCRVRCSSSWPKAHQGAAWAIGPVPAALPLCRAANWHRAAAVLANGRGACAAAAIIWQLLCFRCCRWRRRNCCCCCSSSRKQAANRHAEHAAAARTGPALAADRGGRLQVRICRVPAASISTSLRGPPPAAHTLHCRWLLLRGRWCMRRNGAVRSAAARLSALGGR